MCIMNNKVKSVAIYIVMIAAFVHLSGCRSSSEGDKYITQGKILQEPDLLAVDYDTISSKGYYYDNEKDHTYTLDEQTQYTGVNRSVVTGSGNILYSWPHLNENKNKPSQKITITHIRKLFTKSKSVDSSYSNMPIIDHDNNIITATKACTISKWNQNKGGSKRNKWTKEYCKDDIERIKHTTGNMAIDSDNLFAFLTNGSRYLYKINLDYGSIVWQQELPSFTRSPPLIIGDIVVISSMNDSIYAFDKNTGTKLWMRVGALAENIAAPLHFDALVQLDQNKIVQHNTEEQINVIDVQTGRILSSTSISLGNELGIERSSRSIGRIPIVSSSDPSIIFAITSSGYLCAVNYKTSSILWRKYLNTSRLAWAANGLIYVLSDDTELIAVDQSSGDIVWMQDIKSIKMLPKGMVHYSMDKFSQPIVIGGLLSIKSHDGYVMLFDPLTGELQNIFSTQSKKDIRPLLAYNQKLYLFSASKTIMYQS